MKNKIKDFLLFVRKEMNSVIILVIWLTISSWIFTAFSFDNLFGDTNKSVDYTVNLLLFGGWIISAFIFLYNSKKYLHLRTVSMIEAKPSKVLILPLSGPSHIFQIVKDPGENQHCFKIIDKKDGFSINLDGKSIADDIEKLNRLGEHGKFFTWQQPLRSIKHHLSKVELIYLIGSSSKRRFDGSYDCLDAIEVFFSRYLEIENSNAKIIQHDEEIDFEDYTAVSNALQNAMKKIINLKQQYAYHDITTDITGGTKSCSIACAITTLNNQSKFEYVSTNNDDNESYDIEMYRMD